MNSTRFSFAPVALVALLAGPRLHAASFEHLHGDSAHAETGGYTATTATCPSGGFLTVGNTANVDSTSSVVYAVRTAADGSSLWQKTYALGGAAAPFAVAGLRNSTGFVMAGIASLSGRNEAFLMKVDCDGAPVWTQTYPGRDGFLQGVSGVVETASGDLVVAGYDVDDRNDADIFRGLLFRTDASGALLWSRAYAAGSFTAFRAIAASGRDLVLVGDRSETPDSQSHPLVVRVGADGRLSGPRHCTTELQTWAFGTAVTALEASRFAGQFVIAGETLGTRNDLLMVRTGDDTCRLEAARIVQAAPANAVAEVKRPLPEAGRGTLAVASAFGPGLNLPTDALLLTVSPATLAPLSGHLFGDHATETTATTHSALTKSVVPLRDGFLLTGDNTSSELDPETFFQDSDLYVVKTDARGNTSCSVSRVPPSQPAPIKAARVRVSLEDAGLTGVVHTDVVVTGQDTTRNACQ